MAEANKPLALITGASSGIGYELAKQFAEHGYDLLVVAEDDGIQRAAKDFEGLGAQVEAIQSDLATFDGVEKVAKRVEGRPVDSLVLNAGVGVWGDFATETKLEDELKLIALNVVSTVHLAKRVTKGMKQRQSGKILITSSVVGEIPATLDAVYGASKAFDLQFANALREELRDVGVTVTALMPGATETNFFHRAGMDETNVGQAEKDSAEQVAKDGFAAMMEGKDKVVAGSFKNWLQVKLGRVLPDSVKAKMHHKQASPSEK